MKLFFAPGTCSLAPHIILHEAGIAHEREKVDLKTKQCASGDYRSINPKGSVPSVQLDNGEVLTEGPAILQYLADMNSQGTLIPKNGTWDRYRLQEWLNFITSEIHKGFTPLFGADRMVPSSEGNQQLKAFVKEALGKKFTLLAQTLEKQPFLMGEMFTVADAYLFTCLSWAPKVGIDLKAWPSIDKFMARIADRPKVQAALKAEA